MNPLDLANIQDRQAQTIFLDPEQRVADLALAHGRSEEGHVFFLKQSFFFSILIHLTLFLALLWGFTQPNKRPIQEVNHWVVNLISEWNAEPKGVRNGNIEGATLALPRKQEKPRADQVPAIRTEIPFSNQATGDTESLIAPEAKSPALKTAQEDLSPLQSAPPSSRPQMEDALKVMEDTANHKVQMGQVLFSMKMQEQVSGIKFKYFQKNVKTYLEKTIQASISEEERIALQGKSASAKISFLEKGIPPEIAILQESDPTLAALLKEKIDWGTVNPSATYSLPHKNLKVRAAVNEAGNITVRVELL